MSSLAISLLLLVVLAVAVALVYNLHQSSRTGLKWPKWARLSQGMRGARDAHDRAVPRARDVPEAASPPPPVARGEPRLDVPGSAYDESRAGHESRAGQGGGAAQAEVPAPAAWRAPDDAPEAEFEAATYPAAARELRADAPDAARAAPLAGAPVDRVAGAAADVPARDGPARDEEGLAGTGVDGGQPVLSEVFDCIVEMPLPSAFGGERLVALTQRFRRAGAKPVAVEGRIADGAAQPWSALTPVRQYDALRVGILMANRHGALNALEYSDFVAGVQSIAEALSAPVDIPEMAAVLARARDLDATCAQLDAQVGVNVEAPEALGPAQLAALAGSLSVVERGSNRYARLGPQGEVIFSVALADAPNRLTFLLDVPRSSPSWNAWERMVEAANACARRLGGRVVDDGGRALAEASLAQIGRQLAQRYQSLEAIGVPAGSALALRVFN